MREGWEIKKFEDCIQKVKSTKKIPRKSFLIDGEYPIVSQEKELINGFWNNVNDVLKVDKPIVIFGDHTKTVKYIDFDFVKGADGIVILLPINEINSKFFAYQIQNIKLRELGYARHYRLLKENGIAYPSLQEQQQIVAILDQAFEAIDQAKANIEKNIANAKELFQSKLNAIFSQKGDGWEEDKLKNITTKIGSGATPRGGQAAYKESGISLIRSMNVHDAGFTSKKLAFIDDEQASKLNNVIIEEDDVLLNITGASVARCCLAIKEFIPARVNQHVSIIRPIKDKIDSNYLHFLLTSKKNKDLLLGIGEQGSTRQAITKVQIENFVVSYPNSIEEQKSLIAEVTTIKTKSKKIIKIYKDKLNNLEDLKKSILQKAFAGELTSPERTQYSKDGRSPSDETQTNKNPERVT
jgi:type I restriction enzyme S subunit